MKYSKVTSAGYRGLGCGHASWKNKVLPVASGVKMLIFGLAFYSGFC